MYIESRERSRGGIFGEMLIIKYVIIKIGEAAKGIVKDKKKIKLLPVMTGALFF